MSWYNRRARFIAACLTEPGYGTPRMMSDVHIGRVLMFRKYGCPAGFLPAGSHVAAGIDGLFREAQRQRTLKLPKP